MNSADTIQLGRTSLRVSRLGLGGGPLAGLFQDVPEAQAAGAVNQALEQGIRLFDTAPLYGHGLSEQRMGAVLRSRKRDSFVLATKAGRLLLPAGAGERLQSHFARPLHYRPVFDFTWDGVMRSFESSLKRLNMDRIDIIYIHDPDDHCDDVAKGAYPALDSLRRQRVVGALGAAMNQWELLLRFASLYDFDCFLLASRYTLLDQSALAELLPVCVSKQIGVIVGAPFNSGILATGARPDAKFEYSPAQPEILQKVRRIEAVCEMYGVPLRAAALQFPLMHEAVCAVIPGARSPAEVDDNCRMISAVIPCEFWNELKHRHLLPESAPTG